MIIATIPVYNDAKILAQSVRAVAFHLTEFGEDGVIVIADDGSTDRTNQIARTIVGGHADTRSSMEYVRLEKNSGRGKVLTTAWSRIQGDTYLFLDSDLSTDMRDFSRLIRGIGAGYDLVTGSRYLPESRVERPPLRRFVSIGYNLLVRTLFRDGIADHQCGFKAFSARLIKELLPSCKDGRWFWDTEMIVLAKLNGYPVKELPVVWKEKKGMRTPIRRLMQDVYLLGKGLLSLWWRIYTNPVMIRRIFCQHSKHTS